MGLNKYEKIYIPSSGLGDWKALLADPEKHWARVYSARSLAHAWEDSDGFSPEILNVLRQSAALQRIEPRFIFPEGEDGGEVKMERRSGRS